MPRPPSPWLVGVALLLVNGTSSSRSSAQAPAFRAATTLVRLDVLATARGRPIVGLGIDDFEVRDNGVAQRVVSVAHSDTLHAVLVLDASGSVAGQRLQQLRAACEALVAKLTTDDRVTIVVFADSATPLVVDAPPGPAVVAALDQVRPTGGTAMLDALVHALRLVPSGGRPTFVMLLTDGVDTSSWTSPAAARRALARVDAVLYGVTTLSRRGDDGHASGYTEADSWWQPRPQDARHLLDTLADMSGGQVTETSREGPLDRLFARIVDQYRQRYIVAFEPDGASVSPGWHTVEVRLTRRPGEVTARDGYWAGGR